ncbi:MAG: hypothetical protein AAGA70_18630, partial [Pseudomonadota bacterium]
MSDLIRPGREARLRKLRRMRRARRARRAGKWSILSLSVIGILSGLAVLLILDQTVRAPEWLRERIASRLEQNMGGLQMSFGDVQMVIHEGWRPRVSLRDVVITEADGRPILTLSDLRSSVAMRPLLRGQVQPKQIEMTGALISLRRDRNGAFALAFEGGSGQVATDRTLPSLIEEVDAVFEIPAFAALTELSASQIRLHYEDAMSGQTWTVDSGSVRLTRDADELNLGANISVLSARDFASTVEVNYASQIGETEATFGLTLSDVPARDIASQSLALAWLEPLRAPLSGALRGSINADGTLGP